MAKQTLYAYVQGADLAGVVETLEARLDALVAGRTWVSKDVWVVNQQVPAGPGNGAAGGPEWDLGVNLALAAPRTRPPAWVDDVVAIATAFGAMHRETKRTFVIGIHDDETDATRDLFTVDSDPPDLEALKAALAAAK